MAGRWRGVALVFALTLGTTGCCCCGPWGRWHHRCCAPAAPAPATAVVRGGEAGPAIHVAEAAPV
jgi:hypothetical protein